MRLLDWFDLKVISHWQATWGVRVDIAPLYEVNYCDDLKQLKTCFVKKDQDFHVHYYTQNYMSKCTDSWLAF